MRAKTIDDVLEILAAIVTDTLAERDPLGFFLRCTGRSL
jgi:hypothetical protein